MSDCKNKHLVGACMLQNYPLLAQAVLKMARIESSCKNLSDSRETRFSY